MKEFFRCLQRYKKREIFGKNGVVTLTKRFYLLPLQRERKRERENQDDRERFKQFLIQ